MREHPAEPRGTPANRATGGDTAALEYTHGSSLRTAAASSAKQDEAPATGSVAGGELLGEAGNSAKPSKGPAKRQRRASMRATRASK